MLKLTPDMGPGQTCNRLSAVTLLSLRMQACRLWSSQSGGLAHASLRIVNVDDVLRCSGPAKGLWPGGSTGRLICACMLDISLVLIKRHLCCRFVLSQDLLASAVIGATSPKQLSEITKAAQRGPLDRAALDAIDKVHQAYPNPAP